MTRQIIPRLGLPGLIEEQCRVEKPSPWIKREVIHCRAMVADRDRICPQGCPDHMESKGVEKSLILDIPQGTTWRQLDLRYPILRCRHCGTKRNLRPAWLDITRPMTSRLVSMIEHESHNQTATEVARRTGVDPRNISTIFDEAVRRWKPIALPQAPRRLGIDEAHIGGKDRGVVVDLDTGHLIAILEGRSEEDFRAFFQTMEGRETVRVVAIDMTRLYASIAKLFFPNAEVVADRWHVTQMARAVVNTWRMKIRKPKTPHRSANRPKRGGTPRRTNSRKERSEQPKPTVLRAMLQKRAGRLMLCEREILGRVLADNHELRIAYEIREALFNVFDEEDPQVADTMLTSWLNRVAEVVKDVPQLRAVANAVSQGLAWPDHGLLVDRMEHQWHDREYQWPHQADPSRGPDDELYPAAGKGEVPAGWAHANEHRCQRDGLGNRDPDQAGVEHGGSPEAGFGVRRPNPPSRMGAVGHAGKIRWVVRRGGGPGRV